MNEADMLQRLQEHHRAIEAGLGNISRHCVAASWDGPSLQAERSRLTAVSIARSRFVSEVVAPAVLQQADDGLRTELSELWFVTVAKRMVSNDHIARWRASAIEEDRAGYCAAHREIRTMMEAQMEFERCVLIARLQMSTSNKSVPASEMETVDVWPGNGVEDE